MCLGIPMEIVEDRGEAAICRQSDGSTHEIDMRLVDTPGVGGWVMTYLGAAREVMTAEQAAQVDDALLAIGAAMRGENVDHLFADLVNREPELPDFLKKQ